MIVRRPLGTVAGCVLAILVILPGGLVRAEIPYLLDLDAAIDRALQGDFGIRLARLQLASSQSSLITAENRFDFQLQTTYTHDGIFNRNDTLSDPNDPDAEIFRDLLDDTERLSLTVSKEFQWGADVALTGDFSRSRIRFAETEPLHGMDLTLSYTQPLWGGRGRKVATEGLVNSRIGYLDEARRLTESEMRLIVDVTRSFYQVARSKTLIDINQAAADRAQDRLDAARLRLEEGLITQIDVARSERELRNRQNAVIASQESWEDARDAMLLLLGEELDTPFEVQADVAFEPVEIDPDEAIDEGLRARIDLANEKDALELSELAAHVARSNSRPRVDLAFTASTASVPGGKEAATYFDVDNRDVWQLGVTFSHTFGDRSDDEALVRSLIALESAKIRLVRLERRIVQDIKGAVRNIRSLERRIEVLENSVGLAKESERLAKLQLDEGLISTFEWQDDQDQRVQAETDHVNALYDHEIAKTNLDLVLGRYWTAGDTGRSEFLRDDPPQPRPVVPHRPGFGTKPGVDVGAKP